VVGVLFEGCLRRDAAERLTTEDIVRLLGPSSWGTPGHTEQPVPAMYQSAGTGAGTHGPETFGAVPNRVVPVPGYDQLTVPATEAGPPATAGTSAAGSEAYGTPGPAVSATKNAGNGGAYGVPGPAVSAAQAAPGTVPALVENPLFEGPPSTGHAGGLFEINERRTNTLYERPPLPEPTSSKPKGASLVCAM